MNIANVVDVLDRIAPPAYAEDWDNVGLLVGDARRPCRRVMLCIDLTTAALVEARRAKAQLVMAYHPVIFKPLARVTAAASAVVYDAVRAGIAVHSVHTAFDSAVGGANDALADALGMSAPRKPLAPHSAAGGYKVAVFVPATDLAAVSAAAFRAGAGKIGRYTECAFGVEGVGTFRPDDAARPTVGRRRRREHASEIRWEFVCPRSALATVLTAVRAAHSYEQPAIDVSELIDAPQGVGLGRVGPLKRPVQLDTILRRVRTVCGVRRLQLAQPRGARANRKIATLAVGCGSCGRLFRDAVAAGADLYVTGELRHHDAAAAVAGGLTVACVGHSNSERLTLNVLARRLRAALPCLKVFRASSRADADPFEIV